MNVIRRDKIWEFDVDDTLIMWANPGSVSCKITGPTGHVVNLSPNYNNVDLLKKLSTVGWYIRVHSGSGFAWAETVVKALGLEDYVHEVTSKPSGRTDDRPPGDGLAYTVYIDPVTGEEVT